MKKHLRDLPKLLYLADVPVEASYHGSALIYRLLQEYPKDKLRIVEAGMYYSKPERRLPGVEYQQLPLSGKRLASTRLHRWVSSAFSLRAALDVGRLSNLVSDFKFDAVLTVAHGYSWMTAAAYARQHHIPLHLIVHDDWPRMLPDVSPVRQWVDRQFGRCYRQAASRLCVSPFMVEECERRYEVKGSVLYPSRAADAISFAEPPEHLNDSSRLLTCVFAGTINSAGYVRALQLLSEALLPVNGRLVIYGPLMQEQAVDLGLARQNIEVRGLLSSNELIWRLRDEADVLFVPMSFRLEDRDNMKISFPSKLTDYTSLGLPLLIYGPPDCSAVRWAKENTGVAEVIEMEGSQGIKTAIHRLATQPEHRFRLACRAIEIGEQFFSYEAASRMFQIALAQEATACEHKNQDLRRRSFESRL